MMILWVHIYVKTQQAIYFKYVQLIANYTSMKLFKNVLKSSTMAFMAFLMKSMLFTVYSVQFSSVAQSCPTLCDPRNRSTPGLPVHHQLPEFTQTHVRRVGDAIQPFQPLSSPSPPAPPIPPTISVFSNESTLCMRWPKYWSFSFNISPSNEHPGLISAMKLKDTYSLEGKL